MAGMSVRISRVGITAKNRITEKAIKRTLASTLKTRIPLFWLVCSIGTIGPTACMHYGQNQPPDAAMATAKPTGRLCDIESVYDGDTVWAVCDGQREKLRLYCIDAPEMQQKPWGRQSRDHLRRIIGEQVQVEAVDVDRYGRTVARLWSGMTDLNAQMIKDGWAVVYPKYCPVSETGYRLTQENSSGSDLGVWSQAGLHSSPWSFRNR